jgi:hypothetical protein
MNHESTEGEDPMSRVEEIRARLAAATPGPWSSGTKQSDTVVSLNPDVPVSTDEANWYGGAFIGESMRSADQDLVANCPGDLDYLLDLLGALSPGGAYACCGEPRTASDVCASCAVESGELG